MKRTRVQVITNIIFAITLIMALFILVGGSVLGYEVINNPESIGEWLSKFTNGFEAE